MTEYIDARDLRVGDALPHKSGYVPVTYVTVNDDGTIECPAAAYGAQRGVNRFQPDQKILVRSPRPAAETARPPVSAARPPTAGAVLLGHFVHQSDEWHAARATGLGGSDIAAVVGISPYASRYSLFWAKRGDLGPIEKTEAMEWGIRNEPAVRQKFLELHPEYRDHGAGTWANVERPWQIANPDMLLSADEGRSASSLLEVKMSRYGEDWGPTGTDEIPVHVRAQVLWYGDTFGFERAHVAVLICGCEYREYVIDIDPTEAANLRHEGRLFLDDLEAGVVPDIDESDATYQAQRELHPDINPNDVDLDYDTARFFCVSRVELATAEAAHQLAKNQIMDALGDAKRARWSDYTIAQRQARGGGLPFLVAGRKLPDFSGPNAFEEGDAA